MKRPLKVALLLLISSVALGQGANNGKTLPNAPQTVEEAVLVLKTKWLRPKDLDWILRNPQKEVVFTLYRPFGTGVRNEFGLWGDNQALRDSCGNNNPESCSMVIFNRLWESVRAGADTTLVRQLDCQFQLAQSIQINEKGFYKLTTGELVKAFQSQIDDQLAKLAPSGATRCQNALKLEVVGKADLHCYVDAPASKRMKTDNERLSLQDALAELAIFNLFSTSHEPPKITLHFARSCQFPTPPYLFGSGNKS